MLFLAIVTVGKNTDTCNLFSKHVIFLFILKFFIIIVLCFSAFDEHKMCLVNAVLLLFCF